MRSSNTIWLARTVFANPFVAEVWGLGSWFYSTKLFWANGYGGMHRKRRIYGVNLWKVNMVVCGGDGVPILVKVHMG